MKKDSAITEREKDIRDCIINYLKVHQYPPTVREICDQTGIKSTSTVHHHLSNMLHKGIIESDASLGAPRAIRVPEHIIITEIGEPNEKILDRLFNEYQEKIKMKLRSLEYAKGYLYGYLGAYSGQTLISEEFYDEFAKRIDSLGE